MKRGIIILIIILSCCFFISADIFDILFGSSEGEISVGVTTPGLEPPPAGGGEEEGGGGGGGGGIITTQEGFEITPSLIVAKVTKGEPSQEKIKITNIGKTNLTFNLSVESVGKYVFPEETIFTVDSGKVKEIVLNIYVPESETTNYTSGKINAQSKSIIKSSDIILDIRDKTALFDLRTTLLRKILFQGQKAFADIKVLNLGDLKNIDVELETSLIDENRTVYDTKKEMFAINDSYEGKFFLTIPKDIELGNYIFHSKVSYKNVTAESYDALEIIELLIDFAIIIFYIVVGIVLVLITLISVVLRSKLKNA
ncbi:MAG: hypothetical protein WC511_05765 [Candidatus Pacearchaeota archaeon]|jgi:hypothetical protein